VEFVSLVLLVDLSRFASLNLRTSSAKSSLGPVAAFEDFAVASNSSRSPMRRFFGVDDGLLPKVPPFDELVTELVLSVLFQARDGL
jgi:hypothetical protein